MFAIYQLDADRIRNVLVPVLPALRHVGHGPCGGCLARAWMMLDNSCCPVTKLVGYATASAECRFDLNGKEIFCTSQIFDLSVKSRSLNYQSIP